MLGSPQEGERTPGSVLGKVGVSGVTLRKGGGVRRYPQEGGDDARAL